MTTLSDIAAAANDPYLLDRLISAAAEAGIDDPQMWVQVNSRRLASISLTEGGDTIASVYAYAVSVTPPPPGKNPAAVTDEHLRAAVQSLLG